MQTCRYFCDLCGQEVESNKVASLWFVSVREVRADESGSYTSQNEDELVRKQLCHKCCKPFRLLVETFFRNS